MPCPTAFRVTPEDSKVPAVSPIPVAAGLVVHQGRLLITRRPPGTHLAGFWEFPGGKVEPGETWEAALTREMREELGIEIRPHEVFCEVIHRYPTKTVQLRFFLCSWTSGELQAIGCSEFLWVAREMLDKYDFPPADREILTRLASLNSFGEKSSKSL